MSIHECLKFLKIANVKIYNIETQVYQIPGVVKFKSKWLIEDPNLYHVFVFFSEVAHSSREGARLFYIMLALTYVDPVEGSEGDEVVDSALTVPSSGSRRQGPSGHTLRQENHLKVKVNTFTNVPPVFGILTTLVTKQVRLFLDFLDFLI